MKYSHIDFSHENSDYIRASVVEELKMSSSRCPEQVGFGEITTMDILISPKVENNVAIIRFLINP